MAHSGCLRVENGLQTTGRPLPAERPDDGHEGRSDCTSGMGGFRIALVAARRYPLVDEQAQVVLGTVVFLRNPGVAQRRNGLSEFFFIDENKIREIHAAMFYPAPDRPVPNWPPYDGNFPLPAMVIGQTASNVRPLLWQPGMQQSEVGEVNVFRRFSSDRDAEMREFYGDVLGLTPLDSSAAGAPRMLRYPVGASEVKLFPVAPSDASTAAVDELVGVRLITFFYADEASLIDRFEQHGHSPPQFHTSENGGRAALAQDPDGEWVELVVVPGAADELLDRFEIGITVSDLEASRAFYRDFLGLDEQASVHDARLGATKYTYKHAKTTINLWTFGDELPKDAQTAGMQYIVWDVEAVNQVAQTRGATIDRPLSDPGRMRTVWLTDPDGVSNYFAEYSGHDNRPPDGDL